VKKVVTSRPKYDPVRDGALCATCPMPRWAQEDKVPWAPVPAKHTRGAPQGLLLGEAPGAAEAEKGAPFVGTSGVILNTGLKAASISRGGWDVDNVIACQPKKNKYDLLAHRLRKDKRYGMSPPEEQHPEIHCRPRLLKTLARSTDYIVMGTKAARAVLPGNPSIMNLRGGPIGHALIKHIDGPRRVLPTVHPAFVARAPRWTRVFHADLRRAGRFFKGKLRWKDPWTLLAPLPRELAHFLAQPSRWWSYDVETDAREPLLARLRCVGICRDANAAERAMGYTEAAIMVPFLSIMGAPIGPLYRRRDFADMLRHAFTDGRMWVGHNAGWYDRLVVEQTLGATPRPLIDTIMLARLAHSEIPKSLGVMGSLYTDVTAWKHDNEGNKLSSDARSDDELHAYCATDCAVTHRIFMPLWAEAAARGANEPTPARPEVTRNQLDHIVQGACAGMSRVGVFIDQPKAKAMADEYAAKVADLLKNVVSLAVSAGAPSSFNPASPMQVGRLLYGRERFNLKPIAYTDSGEPSTAAAVLREHLMSHTLRAAPRAFVAALRRFRAAHKVLTSFIRPLKPRALGGVVDTDGRLRVSWSAHVPVTGRVASSQPMNLQNWPKALRALVVPQPGHKLVGADYDALEGKIAASLWGMKKYVDAFARGEDTHQITMGLAFGERIWSMPGAPPTKALRYHKTWPAGPWGPAGGISGKFDEIRNLCKRYYYGKQYGAGDETVWRLMREAEDEDGNFLNANLQQTEVGAISRRFLKALPEMEAGWEAAKAEFLANDCIREPLTNRRRDFLDGAGADGKGWNEVINFAIQGGAAAAVNIATMDLLAAGYTANYAGHGTGLIQQGHDALVLEVPEAQAPQAARELQECMVQEYPDLLPGVVLTATADVGMTWKEV